MSEPKLIFSSAPESRSGVMKVHLDYLEKHLKQLAIPINGSLIRCQKCAGLGVLQDGQCSTCNGAGYINA
jgi:hypothetical protein